jgi:hypothetical protein
MVANLSIVLPVPELDPGISPGINAFAGVAPQP